MVVKEEVKERREENKGTLLLPLAGAAELAMQGLVSRTRTQAHAFFPVSHSLQTSGRGGWLWGFIRSSSRAAPVALLSSASCASLAVHVWVVCGTALMPIRGVGFLFEEVLFWL